MTAAAPNALYGFIPILALVFILVLPYWQIFRKAGYSSWLALLMFIPVVNFIMIWKRPSLQAHYS